MPNTINGRNATMVHEIALSNDPLTGELVSYWPEHWPPELLLQKKMDIGTPFFAAGFQNDPSGLEGNILKDRWLHTYTIYELEAIRATHGGPGFRRVGIDPTSGGDVRTGDYMAMMLVEVIANKAYALDFRLRQVGVQGQGAYIASVLNEWQPQSVFLEEGASKGYVYTDLTTNPAITLPCPIIVKKPQSMAGGGKQVRFLQMAARFESGQALLPATFGPNHEMILDPKWEPFQQQWVSFPAGHDDLLDAAFWSIDEAFTTATAVATSISIEELEKQRREVRAKDDPEGNSLPIPRDARGRPLRYIGQRHPRGLAIGRRMW